MRYALQKTLKVECTFNTRDLMSKMFYEDRENVVECRYGQLSSAEQIEKKNKTAKKTK